MEIELGVWADVELLLIEDDDIDAHSVQRAFAKQQMGIPIIRKSDGLEGLAYLRERIVPRNMMILLDLHMPRMNGMEFLQELRADPKLHDLIVFVMSTSSASEDLNRAYKENIAGYITKDRVGKEYQNLTQLLVGFWKTVHFPSTVH